MKDSSKDSDNTSRAIQMSSSLATAEIPLECVQPKYSNLVTDEGGSDASKDVPAAHMAQSGSNGITAPVLGRATLAVLVFYSVSGGPFGVESAVRSAGYRYTILGFLIGPLVWSLQEALMTAELACAFPEASGGMAWVEEAFGPLAGWMAGYLGWVAGATDNAIYPVMFVNYLLQVLGSRDESIVDAHPLWRFLGLGVTSIFLAYINWRGLEVVGTMSVIICLVAMSPFLLLLVLGASKVDPSRWFETLPSNEAELLTNVTDDDLSGGFFPNAGIATTGILWRPFLNNLFWNLNSFDSAASFSADVGPYPENVIPSAMFYAVFIVVLAYLLPLFVAIGATQSEPHQWVDGYLATIANEIVGPWLQDWTVFALGITNIAMFQAELSTDAFQLMGMAERGHVPKLFSRRSQYGTPTYSILLGTAVIVSLGQLNLDKIIELLNFNYSIALLMEYSAFLYLRVTRPDLKRPWKIPLNTLGCFVFLAPTYFFILLVMLLSDFKSFGFSLGMNILGLSVYGWRRYGVCIKPSLSQKYFSYSLTLDHSGTCDDDDINLQQKGSDSQYDNDNHYDGNFGGQTQRRDRHDIQLA